MANELEKVSGTPEASIPTDVILRLLVDVRMRIEALQESIKTYEGKKNKLEGILLNRMSLTEAIPSFMLTRHGRRWVIKRADRTVVSVTNWQDLYNYILKTGDFTLLSKSVPQNAGKMFLEEHPDTTWLQQISIPKLSYTSTPDINVKE